MKYGVENSNYRHGGYCGDGDRSDFQVALAKDRLIRVMKAKVDASGKCPFSNEEMAWSMRVVQARPDWARDTLAGLGFNDAYYNREGGDQ